MDLAKLVPLFSGSKGNSYYIGSGGQGVLIDAGRSCKQIENALISNDIDIKTIKAVFITHEHIDHCQGLKVFASRYKTDVYLSGGTLEALKKQDKISDRFETHIIEDNVIIGDMKISRFNTPHDASESCGYSIVTADGRTAVVATDMGYMTDTVRDYINKSNVAVIESNHDVNMLRNGPYPYLLKRRILSDKGHLSNEACAKELESFINKGVTRFLLAHLSAENNTPAVALETSICALKQAKMVRNVDFTIDIAPAETNGKAIFY